MTTSIVTVGELAAYLRQFVEADDSLQDIWVEGEVSSYTVASSGHAYFTIKDDRAAIDCVMWKAIRQRQAFRPAQGDNVLVHGSISIYERTVRVQVKANLVHPAGAGLRQLQLELLRQQLAAEGLFDPTRERPLPLFPRRIGVVTSSTGAVWHDIQQVIARRYPLVELLLSPTNVQGDRAAESLVRALEALDQPGVDVIIIARGGGSAEDLQAFDDERLARAIFACTAPVISAIGHETDTSIADLVADVRASTPSVAAELATPDRGELLDAIEGYVTRAAAACHGIVLNGQRDLDSLEYRRHHAASFERIALLGTRVAILTDRLRQAGRNAVTRRTNDVIRSAETLRALDPDAVLRRGYARLSVSGSGRSLESVGDVAIGDQMTATLADGSFDAWVTVVRSSRQERTRGTR